MCQIAPSSLQEQAVSHTFDDVSSGLDQDACCYMAFTATGAASDQTKKRLVCSRPEPRSVWETSSAPVVFLCVKWAVDNEGKRFVVVRAENG